MNPHFSIISDKTSLEEISNQLSKVEAHFLLVVEDMGRQIIGTIANLIPSEKEHLDNRKLIAADIMDRKFVIIKEDATLLTITARMQRSGASVALVGDDETASSRHIRGFLTAQEIGATLGRSLELYAD